MLQAAMTHSRRYHENTKYSPETISGHPGLDWPLQPKPYKVFRSKDRVELSSSLLVASSSDSGLPILLPHASGKLDLPRLSTLLLHTNGVTAIQETAQEAICFRAAPSAGALYPTEVYVAIRGIPELPDGIYNYQVKEHELVPVMEGDFWRDFEAVTFGADAVKTSNCLILLSQVYYRSSWRYQDRAYRRILLDTGHVLGNLTAHHRCSVIASRSHRCFPGYCRRRPALSGQKQGKHALYGGDPRRGRFPCHDRPRTIRTLLRYR